MSLWDVLRIGKQATSEKVELLRNALAIEVRLDLNFMVLAFSACVIATLGLLTNSAAVIIGAMIVAPLMLPLRGLAFAILELDFLLVRQGLTTVAVGTIFSILLACCIGSVFALPASEFGSELLARTEPNLADLGVALAAGGVSAFARIRPKISDALAGTAFDATSMCSGY